MDRNILFFDFEVFKKDWMVCIKYHKQDKWINIHNNVNMLIQVLKQEKNSLWVGFNNHHYDDYILSALLANKDPFTISKNIVEEGKYGWQLGLTKPSIASIDVKQDNLDNLQLSLKEAEANMGLSIEETEVDFNLDRQLTPEELTQTLNYCHYDVIATEYIFNNRLDWVKAKLSLINDNGWPLNDVRKTSAQLTAKALGALSKPKHYNDEFEYIVPQDLILGKYNELLNYFKTPLPPNINLTYNLANLECKFGVGGLHGAIPKFKSNNDSKYAFLDFTSYYPDMMIKRNYISRNMSSPDGYAKIFEQRVEAKRNGNADKAQALKMIIVTTYGAMDNKYNNLYDPKMRKHVSITGQLFLADLIDKVEPYINLIQVNTDGILVEILDEVKLKEVCNAYEQRTGFTLDWDYVDAFYQKDVNNYFAKLDNGEIKVKGSYLKQSNVKHPLFAKNHLRVIDLALNAYFDKGIDIETFIKSHNNIQDFQMVAKATRIFDGGLVEYKNGEIRNEWGRVARVFATTNPQCGELFKLKKGSPHKVPNLPKQSFIWNKDIKDLKIEQINIDYQFYIDLVLNRINDFGIKYERGEKN